MFNRILSACVVLGVGFFAYSTFFDGEDAETNTRRAEVTNYSECVVEGGTVTKDSTTDTCAYNGNDFVNPHFVPNEPPPLDGEDTPAKEAGRKMGETFNDLKDTSREVWDGFSEETNVDKKLSETTDKAKQKVDEWTSKLP